MRLLQHLQSLKLTCSLCLSPSTGEMLKDSLLPAPGQQVVQYKCSSCTGTGRCELIHNLPAWFDVVMTALTNLHIRCPYRRAFSFRETVSFIDANWNQLCGSHSRSTGWQRETEELLGSHAAFTAYLPSAESTVPTYALSCLLAPPPPSASLAAAPADPSALGGVRQGRLDESMTEPTSCSSGSKLRSDLTEVGDDGKADKDSHFWCHQCKQKHEKVMHCSSSCNKKYCVRCFTRHYDEDLETIDTTTWSCFFCRGICCCALCRRKKSPADGPEEEGAKPEKVRGIKRARDSAAGPDGAPVDKKARLAELLEGAQVLRVVAKQKSRYLVETCSAEGARGLTWLPKRALAPAHKSVAQFRASPRLVLPIEVCRRALADAAATPSAVASTLSYAEDVAMIDNSSRTVSSASSPAPLKRKLTRVHHTVALSDLLRDGLLSVGDMFTFRNHTTSGACAMLQGNGKLRWNGAEFSSLSTWAKSVAGKIGVGNEGTLYNGWRVVHCRGVPLDTYRRKFIARYPHAAAAAARAAPRGAEFSIRDSFDRGSWMDDTPEFSLDGDSEELAEFNEEEEMLAAVDDEEDEIDLEGVDEDEVLLTSEDRAVIREFADFFSEPPSEIDGTCSSRDDDLWGGDDLSISSGPEFVGSLMHVAAPVAGDHAHHKHSFYTFDFADTLPHGIGAALALGPGHLDDAFVHQPASWTDVLQH